jgi:putative MATE family efflux protein
MRKSTVEEQRAALLTHGPVGKTLIKLTIPMIFGLIGIVAFNLVDTYFVGKLGTSELAALSFTFPVVLVIGSLAMGIGMGASAVISRAVGEGDRDKVQRLATDSLLLALIFVGFFIVIGLFTIGPLFRALGAPEDILPLIRQYMKIWYPGMIFVVIPMVGNNAIRAIGDTRTPGLIMLVAAGVNGALDPLLIFGIGPFPRLEIVGAAIATVIARAVTLVVAVYVLWRRERLITVSRVPFKKIFNSWKRVLYIGIPTAAARMIIPVGLGIITRMLSAYGPEAVASFGVSSRIEFFSLTVVTALSVVLGPFVGQNWGAGMHGRARTGVRYSSLFSMLWGALLWAVLALIARPVASQFNENPEVIDGIVLFLRIVPVGYGLQGILLLAVSTLNVLNKPLHSAALRVLQMFVLFVPFAILGSQLLGMSGIFAALSFSYLVSGLLSHLLLKKTMKEKVYAYAQN